MTSKFKNYKFEFKLYKRNKDENKKCGKKRKKSRVNLIGFQNSQGDRETYLNSWHGNTRKGTYKENQLSKKPSLDHHNNFDAHIQISKPNSQICSITLHSLFSSTDFVHITEIL